MNETQEKPRRREEQKDATRLEIGQRIAQCRKRIINDETGRPMSIQGMIKRHPEYKESRWKMWEAGFRAPSFETLPELAKILNTNVGYLYLWTDDPSPSANPSPRSLNPDTYYQDVPALVVPVPTLRKHDITRHYNAIEIDEYNQIFIIDPDDNNINKSGYFVIQLRDDLKVLHIEQQLDQTYLVKWHHSDKTEKLTERGAEVLTVLGRVRGRFDPLP